jgi:hypothetical protein
MRGLRHSRMGRAKSNSGISDWAWKSLGGIFQDFLKPEHSLKLDQYFIMRSPSCIQSIVWCWDSLIHSFIKAVRLTTGPKPPPKWAVHIVWSRASTFRWENPHLSLTLSLLMSYICRAPCKARNFNAVYVWSYVWQRWKPSLSICCTMFQHWINAESFPVLQLCVNTLPATKITLITNGI